MNRRIFLKSLAAALALSPVIVKATEPEYQVVDAVGPRGQLTEDEWQLIKAHMQDYLSTQDIRWGIPGTKKSHLQGVAIFDHQYIVTWKYHPRQGANIAYIDVETRGSYLT